MHEVLVNHLGGLSLPRKSEVRLTDHPDMTLDVYRGRKTTMQQATVLTYILFFAFSSPFRMYRKSYCTNSGFGVKGGIGGVLSISKMLKFYAKVLLCDRQDTVR